MNQEFLTTNVIAAHFYCLSLHTFILSLHKLVVINCTLILGMKSYATLVLGARLVCCYSSCNISNPTMRTGLDFKSAQFDENAKTWNVVQSKLEDLKWHLIRIYHYLKWGELILIQSKDWINFDDQYTSPGIHYYHVSKIKQYGWLIYSWIINEFEMIFSLHRAQGPIFLSICAMKGKFETEESVNEMRCC
jgi:hypothetical protein